MMKLQTWNRLPYYLLGALLALAVFTPSSDEHIRAPLLLFSTLSVLAGEITLFPILHVVGTLGLTIALFIRSRRHRAFHWLATASIVLVLCRFTEYFVYLLSIDSHVRISTSVVYIVLYALVSLVYWLAGTRPPVSANVRSAGSDL